MSSPRDPIPHAGWRSRGYLPHFDAPDAVQHVVFRLMDALPAAARGAVERAPSAERIRTADAVLDKGHGERLLADPRVADIAQGALLHFDSDRYRLLAWCVMPSHVHVLAAQADRHPLSAVVHSWKSFTANAANKILGRSGSFWAPEYYDRYMRNQEQLEATRAYVEANPVAAGLCRAPEEWRFSSAHPNAK